MCEHLLWINYNGMDCHAVLAAVKPIIIISLIMSPLITSVTHIIGVMPTSGMEGTAARKHDAITTIHLGSM